MQTEVGFGVEPQDLPAADDPGGGLRELITVLEYEPLGIPLDRLMSQGRFQLYDEIGASKFLRAFISGGELVLTASRYVGYIPLNDQLALNVEPRFSIRNLTRVLRIAEHIPEAIEEFTRGYQADTEVISSVLDRLTESFLGAITEVIKGGLYKNYRLHHADTSFPKGRILLGKTALRHHSRGVRHRVAIQWHARSPDNGPNRLLKYTLWMLYQRYSGMKPRAGVLRVRSELNRLYRAFAGVELDRDKQFLQDSIVAQPAHMPHSRSYYLDAMQMALLLVENKGIRLSVHSGPIRIPSLLVNMEKAFEAYLRNVLSVRMAPSAPMLRVLDGNRGGERGGRKPLFDQVDSQPATPDIVVERAHGERPVVILEVKYKDIRGDPSREDINQIIGYGMSYRAKRLVLAYPRSSAGAAGLHLVGSIDSTQVFGYAFDLAGDLNSEEAEFGAAIQAMALA
jgi:5-methylcytosine-specific restriction enzyme subunit McrC